MLLLFKRKNKPFEDIEKHNVIKQGYILYNNIFKTIIFKEGKQDLKDKIHIILHMKTIDYKMCSLSTDAEKNYLFHE